MNPATLLHLLHLSSPALPVGAFSYSQGLEWAVESSQVTDEPGAGRWISDALQESLLRWEAPLVGALVPVWTSLLDLEAPADTHLQLIGDWNLDFLASRETAELRAETVQMGHSCLRVLPAMPGTGNRFRERVAWLATFPETAFPTAWALAAAVVSPSAEAAVTAYCWAWLENQVLAAVKLVPLGQSAGQRLLFSLTTDLPRQVQAACRLQPEDWSNLTPGLALASSLHETQYSRLFRS